ncbi:hypothetical protein GOV08_05470 [Candidatus Woesearchaeota archaeon]|nr:hypothetical protein [Candidatus Woesearchaeota archaeon]
MAGALVHIGVGVLLALIVHFIHFKFEYSIAIFIGGLLPDVIKFGFTAIKQITLNIFKIQQDSFYMMLSDVTSSYTVWFTLGFFVFTTTVFLFHYHYIKKKGMEEYDKLYIFLLIGIIVHLILDTLIIETNPWLF